MYMNMIIRPPSMIMRSIYGSQKFFRIVPIIMHVIRACRMRVTVIMRG